MELWSGRGRAAGQVSFGLDLSAGSRARALASEVADKLLANPVIESYRVEVDQ